MTAPEQHTAPGGGTTGAVASRAGEPNWDNGIRVVLDDLGWPVFPCYEIRRGQCTCRKGRECESPGKHPRTANGHKSATTNPEQIASWHQQWPNANWAVVPQDGFVIDVDPRNGGSLDDVQPPIPKTLRVITGGGGTHAYFRGPITGSRSGWLRGVDVKGSTGYVLLPGSSHISGGLYQWAEPRREVAVAPDALVQSIRQASDGGSSGPAPAGRFAGVSEGHRNDHLFRALCAERNRLDDDPDMVWAAARVMNSRNDPPLSDDELGVIVTQVLGQPREPDLDPALIAWAEQALLDPDEAAIADAVRSMRIRREASRRIAREEGAAAYPQPEPDADGLLSDLIVKPPVFERQRVDGLIGMQHNSVLVAQYKAGKTTLGCNVMRCAVDGMPFLERDVHMDGGRIGWLNGEMDRDDFLDYIRPMHVQHPERIAVRTLRGRRLNLLDDTVAEEFVRWAKTNEVEWLWVDSWRLLCSWAGLSENVNSEVESLTQRLDAIKHEAGIVTATLLAHTGRAQHEEGREHARGATALDDWQDSRLVLTRQGPDRFLYAEGRGVQLPETQLVFDPETHLLTPGVGDRRNVRDDRGLREVEAFVTANPGCNTTEVKEHLRRAANISHAAEQTRTVKNAEDAGLVHYKPGPRNAKNYYPGPSDEQKMAASLAKSMEGYTHA